MADIPNQLPQGAPIGAAISPVEGATQLQPPAAPAADAPVERPIEEPRLGEFYDSDELSDVILLDGERRFRCHKIILASKSSFFRAQFRATPGIAELPLPPRSRIFALTNEDLSLDPTLLASALQQQQQQQQLPVQQLSAQSGYYNNFQRAQNHNGGAYGVDVVSAVLKFVYSDYDFAVLISNGLTTHNCLEFFAYFCDLEISSGVFLIERFILQYYLAPENCLHLLNVGLRFRNTNFVENAVKLAAEKLGKLLKLDPNFYQALLSLSYPAIYAVVSSNDIQLDSEDILLSLVHDYIENAATRPPPLPPAQPGTTVAATDPAAQNLPNPLSTIPEEQPGMTDVSKLLVTQEQQANQDDLQQQQPQAEAPAVVDDQQPVAEGGALDAAGNGDQVQEPPGDVGSAPEVIIQPAPSGSAVLIQPRNYDELPVTSLTSEEVASLVKQVRLGYVSHSALSHFCDKPSFAAAKDVFFKAISLKLSQYETNQQGAQQYESLNWNPRESYFHKVATLHPAAINTQHNVAVGGNAPQLGFTNASALKQSQFQNSSGLGGFGKGNNNIGKSQVIEKAIIPKESIQLNFTYSSDFDENGMFFFLGSRNKTQEFSNPFYASEVMPFCSSLKIGRIEDLTARLSVNTICTENEKNAFFGFDLGEDRFLFPTCYTIRNRSSPSSVLYNWMLEGSNDNTVWHEIDRRVHFSKDAQFNLLMENERELLRKPSKSSTWGIDTKKLKETLKKIGIDAQGFRVFRITQLSQNGNNTHEFAIGALEFYGKAYGTQWTERSA